MRTHIIYIPGLGDRYDPFRRACLKLWKLWGVSTEHVPITWYDGGGFEQKNEYISKAIERADGKRIVIIGESAGATLALHAGLAQPRIERVITLCGVARQNTPIAGYLRKRAPALNDGVNSLSDSFEVDIHSVRAWMDGIVGRKYSVVDGSTEHVVWSVGHFFTIVLCLTFLSPYLVHIAKKPQ